MRKRSMTNVLLVVLAAAIFVLALVMGTRSGEFVGTDSAATETIEKSDPGYKPWFQPLWTQPGGEVESGLFAMQAALGAGLVGFVLGTFRERRKNRDRLAGVEGAGASSQGTHSVSGPDSSGSSTPAAGHRAG